MVLHLGVVADTSDLIGAVDPGELPVDGIICAYDILIGYPVRTYDCFVCAKQSAAALDDELGVKGNVIFPASFFPPTESSHGCDAIKKLCALPVLWGQPPGMRPCSTIFSIARRSQLW